MPDLTIPAACTEAVRVAVGECCPDMDPPLVHEEAEKIARAVLTAFLAGEASGPWKVVRDDLTNSWELHHHKTGNIMAQPWPTEAKGRAVAAALNALEPDHA